MTSPDPPWDALRALLDREHQPTLAPPLDLARARALHDACGRPGDALPCVLVAGTDGKTSTACALASCLDAAGLRVGLYTSPHLRHPRERIRIGPLPAPQDALLHAAAHVLPHALTPPAASWFEATTVLALHVFAQARLDVAVLEVGLGGTFDATRVVSPALSLITPVGHDHHTTLGPTLPAIAAHKAGALHPLTPAITHQPHPQPLRVLHTHAHTLQAPLWVVHQDVHPSSTPTTLRVRTPARTHTLPLPHDPARAPHLALVLAALDRLQPLVSPDLAAHALTGLARVHPPGRNHTLTHQGTRLLLDTAHTPQAAHSLRARLPNPPPGLLLALARDKSPHTLALLTHQAPFVVVAQPPHPRLAPAHQIAAHLRTLGHQPHTQPSPDLALTLALDLARLHQRDLLVVGSHTLLGAVYELLNHPTDSVW